MSGVTIPWRRQTDSAENSGTVSTFMLTLCAECLIRNYVSRVQKHSLTKWWLIICSKLLHHQTIMSSKIKIKIDWFWLWFCSTKCSLLSWLAYQPQVVDFRQGTTSQEYDQWLPWFLTGYDQSMTGHTITNQCVNNFTGPLQMFQGVRDTVHSFWLIAFFDQ